MSANPTPTDLDNIAGLTPEELASYRAALAEIVAVGMNLMRILNRQAEQATAAAPEFGLAIAYERIARAIRRTILLDCKLAEAAQNPLSFRAPTARTATTGPDAEKPESDGPESDPVERIESLERVESEIDNRPIPDIIASIRDDLTLATNLVAAPYRRRAPPNVLARRPNAGPYPAEPRTTASSPQPPPATRARERGSG